MLRPVSLTVKTTAAGLVLASLVLVAGCYWYRYGDVMRTHLELLDSMVRKLCSNPARAPGLRPSGPTLSEYEYPLARARDFARVAEKRCPERHSLRAFRRVLSLYDRVVRDMGGGANRRCTRGPSLALRIRRVERWLAREPGRCG
jgi:hypothetical protein